MALNTEKDLKLYYSIKEVAEMFKVNQSTLRYWETVFKQIQPRTNAKGVRQYTKQNIEEIREIFLRHRAADTPVGIVHHAAREEESKIVSTLQDFTKEKIDMFSLVIIGNSRSYVKEGYMITPRGYEV